MCMSWRTHLLRAARVSLTVSEPWLKVLVIDNELFEEIGRNITKSLHSGINILGWNIETWLQFYHCHHNCLQNNTKLFKFTTLFTWFKTLLQDAAIISKNDEIKKMNVQNEMAGKKVVALFHIFSTCYVCNHSLMFSCNFLILVLIQVAHFFIQTPFTGRAFILIHNSFMFIIHLCLQFIHFIITKNNGVCV